MAKDKIILAELDIDTKNLVKAAQDTKKEIESLIERQQKLSDRGKETSAEFVRNEAALKSLKLAYKEQTDAIAAQINEDGKLLTTKKAIKEAVNELNQSENDYLDNNKKLIELKKQLNTTDDDYEKRLAKINEKIHENNQWLEENGSKHAKLITTFNDYKQQAADAFASINVFNGGLGDFMSRAQEAGGTGKLFKGAIEGMTGGIKGMGAAIKANPIGFLLSLIAPLIEQFQKFAPLTNAVEKAMAGLAPILDLASKPIQWMAEGITFLVNGFTSLLGSMSSAADEAIKLQEAEALLNTEMALQEERNDAAKKQIDGLIAKSKDQTLSEKERLNALEAAAAAEMQNYNERKRLSEETYRIAQARLQHEKDLSDDEIQILQNGTAAQIAKLQESKSITAEELKTLQDAKMQKQRIADEEGNILDRQAADQKALQDKVKAENETHAREAEANRQKQYDKALTRQKQMLDLFVAESDARGKSLKEQLDYEDEYAQKSLDLLKEQLRLKKITQLEYQIGEIKITKDKEDSKRTISEQAANDELQNAKARLELELQRSKSYLEGVTEINRQLVENENTRLNENFNKKLEQLAREKGVQKTAMIANREHLDGLATNEYEFIKEMEAMEAENNAQKAANAKKLEDYDKAQKVKEKAEQVAQVEADYQAGIEKAGASFEAQKMVEQQRHNDTLAMLKQQLDNELITQEEYKALTLASEEDLKEKTDAIEEAKQANKLQLAHQTFGNMATIFGKESAVGKAMAVAQATIDTYQAATAAYKAMAGIPIVGPALGAVAAGAAVAAGVQNVKKITGTKTPKAEKGALFSIGGKRHSNGGTLFTGADGTRFEAEQGELIGVMNRNAARHFMAFNNAFPAGSGSAPNYFANGGIVSREIARQQLNVDELAGKIALANASLPQPVVVVQDIITQGNSYVQVRDGANF